MLHIVRHLVSRSLLRLATQLATRNSHLLIKKFRTIQAPVEMITKTLFFNLINVTFYLPFFDDSYIKLYVSAIKADEAP